MIETIKLNINQLYLQLIVLQFLACINEKLITLTENEPNAPLADVLHLCADMRPQLSQLYFLFAHLFLYAFHIQYTALNSLSLIFAL